MAHDIMSQFYACLAQPITERIPELTRIIDQSSPNKDLQGLFPQLINNIFTISFSSGWGLRTITFDANRYEFELLMGFLEPLGPMFRLCYKLLSDPQLKYNLPLNVLPIDLQNNLEKGRCPQYYADMINMDSLSLNVVALALNPFDYYIFNFALHLLNSGQNKSSWENWNSVYFALACDYLVHFLPADPNLPVLPLIPNYTGKVPIVAHLQTTNRPLSSPSLLLLPDLIGINNQHTATQNQTRYEVWRSETLLQVFVDIWMSVEHSSNTNIEMLHRHYPVMCSSPERVRIVRVLVKHIHSLSAKHLSDPSVRLSALLKYGRQIMCTRAYHYVKFLVMTWPLDASFRLVMELWLSLIQPWRYTDSSLSQERYPNSNANNEEGNNNSLDASFTQFIAENFPSYTCIFQLVLPRFMRLDLTAYKNAVMLFRLGKVFAQPLLVPILRDLEKAVLENGSGSCQTPDITNNSSPFDRSFSQNGASVYKWAAIAKQALTELNMPQNFEYIPIWDDSKKQFALEFMSKILTAKLTAEKMVEEHSKIKSLQNKGMWASIKHWLMIENSTEEVLFEECKKVPNYLNNALHYFSGIFGLSENTMLPVEAPVDDNSHEHSSFVNSTHFPMSITNKLRARHADVHYMGDPDLMPITSYESTILIRILYQIATRLNELYRQEFSELWNRNDFWGYIAREVLQKPCVIHTYVKGAASHQNIISEELPARLSLRRLGSHSVIVWFIVGYCLFRLFNFSGLFYIFIIFVFWVLFVILKASLKVLRIMTP